eukprot:1676478-Rhodomonas_salina.5
MAIAKPLLGYYDHRVVPAGALPYENSWYRRSSPLFPFPSEKVEILHCDTTTTPGLNNQQCKAQYAHWLDSFHKILLATQ